MTRHIAETLLGDAVEREGSVLREIWGRVLAGK